MEPVTTQEPRQMTATPRPSLNIVILSFGTRGDVQPYIRIAQELTSHGHRVRLCVPPALEAWARDEYDVDTWSLRYDMAELLRWGQQKPSKKMLSLVNGDFRRLAGYQLGMHVEHWRACIDGGKTPSGERPFVADAILSGPPGMTHVHIAQRLGIPVFLTHFNPKSITREWPHGESYPSDKIFKPCDENREDWIAGDNKSWKFYSKKMINKVRKTHLDLQPLGKDFWPVKFWDLGLPVNYLVSPSVLPRPSDFPDNHLMTSFTFLDPPKDFQPDPALVEFLGKPGPFIYVDFGSNEHLDKRGFTSAIVGAAKANGARVVVRKAWFVASTVPAEVFVTDAIPHSWLLPRVDMVLHSAGAGVTAISLKSGIPSVTIPFRGDQHLWAKALERLGAAPPALWVKELTETKLTTLLKEGLDPRYRAAAKKVAESIKDEPDGATTVVDNFHAYLESIDGYPPRCSLLPDHPGVWIVRAKPELRFSTLAAHILDAQKLCSYGELELLKIVDWDKHASLSPWQGPRDRPNDVVRKQRVAQGAFDASENAAASEEVLSRWEALQGGVARVNGGSTVY